MATPKTELESVQKYPLEKVHISTRNTRQPTVKEVTAEGMVKSMSEVGQITPGIGRPHPTKPGHLELGAGARRRIAAEAAGLTEYSVIVRPMTDDELDLLILVENFQRVNPTPKAEAVAVKRLHDESKMDAGAIGAALGRDAKWVARRMQLLEVIPELFKSWTEGVQLKGRHGKIGSIDHFGVEMMELIGSLLPDTQKKLVVDHEHSFQRLQSRKALNEFLKQKVLCSLDVKWLDDPDTAVKGCGPGCSHDSRKEGKLLLDDDMTHGKCGTCLNPSCFFARQGKANAKKLKDITGGEDLPIVSKGSNEPDLQIGSKVTEVDQLDWNMKVVSTAAVEKDPKLKAKAEKVVLIENGEMKVAYVAKESSGGGSSGGKKKLASPAEKRKKGIELLQGKRWEVVLELLKKALKESTWKSAAKESVNPFEPTAKDGTNLFDLVAVFGLPWHISYSVDSAWKRLDGGEYGEQYKKEKSRLEAMWEGLKTIFNSNFSYRIVSDVVDLAPHMQRVAKLIAFPIDEEKRKADLKVSAPKSWGVVDPHTLLPVKAGAAPAAVKTVKPVKTKAVKKAKGKAATKK